jgi:hypothetical protein
MKQAIRQSDSSWMVLQAAGKGTGLAGGAWRRRWTAQEKSDWISRFEESGMSGLTFSRKMGLPYSSFCLWRRQVPAHSPAARTGFAEVRVAIPAVPSIATVHLPSGARLEIAVGADPAWIGAVIQAAQLD